MSHKVGVGVGVCVCVGVGVGVGVGVSVGGGGGGGGRGGSGGGVVGGRVCGSEPVHAHFGKTACTCNFTQAATLVAR